MSKLLISQYYNQLEKLIQYGGSRNEENISNLFGNLLNEYCKTKDFLLIPQLPYKQERIKPDGTIKDALRLDWGYWESKDEYDNLDEEIEKKLAKGYPDDNILFEDSQTAILIQKGQETLRVSMKNPDDLDKILNAFINYIRPEVEGFRQAIFAFKEDLPTILTTLRDLINNTLTPPAPLSQGRGGRSVSFDSKTPLSCGRGAGGEGINTEFQTRFFQFLKLCQDSINPNINSDDIREMMIQHILTEDIFLTIFNESQFHRENNIAKELQGVIETFFKGNIKRQTLSSIERYYNVIRRTASNICNHHEKQKFLKAIYENFYKAYNPLAADRLGIVYTPNEIVKFMIESTDHLLQKHFHTLLEDKDVEILDPATGTGTFITEIIEYLHKNRLKDKYKNEIHCNEVGILPYYIANLNIEYTYQQKMGEYEEFNNICFVDTLDHTSFHGKQTDLFAVSLENTERIKRQNDKKISVIIGNPPYNANQQNENDNNKNRDYPAIDKRIKATYIKESNAQKTKLYDMYSRFIRWATDRLGNNGIIAFVSNSSFINAKTFDGFRKVVSQEFNELWIIDTKGNARNSGERRRQEGGNIFSDQIKVGIAVYFLIRSEKAQGFKVFYNAVDDYLKADDKKNYFVQHKLQDLNFTHIIPDKNNNWINLAEKNDFDSLIPVANKETKLSKNKDEEKAIFKLFSLGVATNRDEWIFDYNINDLEEKIMYFIKKYNLIVNQLNNKKIDFVLDNSIKWSADLKNSLLKKIIVNYEKTKIIPYLYRPFMKNYYYSEQILSDRLTQNHYDIFYNNLIHFNQVIVCRAVTSNKNFHCLASNLLFDLHLTGDSQCLPLYSYDKKGKRQENITDWALEKFREYYKIQNEITKEDIFYYVYAVLHNPEYRKKYELNLKRDFPRIPFYDNFDQWVKWGKKLMELHLNYETIKPYKFKIQNSKFKSNQQLKPKLKADKIKNEIILDDVTTLTEIPPEVWEYKLGNRSALEWILDQYKEKKPKDPTIAEKFNHYRFADYKETVIDLLMRVTTVSIETMKIIKEMEGKDLD